MPLDSVFRNRGVLLEAAPGFMEWMLPSSKGIFDAKRNVAGKAMLALDNDRPTDPSSKKTIFASLCDQSLPPEERTLKSVEDEALLVLAAGTETTARVLTIGAFHLYRDRSVLQKLRDEVKQVMPEPASKVPLAQLEKLPYLSLRMAHSVTIRLPRIAPAITLVYQGYTIPPGTPVSQLLYFVHTDPSIFPSPETFNPERWIGASSKGERLTKFLVSFAKSPRLCLGMNLAYSELYQMFAILVRGFDLEIYDTTPESIRITRDLLIGLPDSDALTVRSLVTEAFSY
ncbi:hypothetical protein BBP40_002539 [Aspergillus hancockii]|nr:hypothetical protein BBP40_002539 [Aspergillus hancockii]